MQLNLIYVIGTYPGLTTTFIDREIQKLRKWGVNLQILSIRRPSSSVPLSKEQRELQKGIIYLLPPVWSKLFLSQLHYILLRPGVYFKTLTFLLTRPHPNWLARIKTFLHFGEGVYAAYLLRKRQFQEIHCHFVDRSATLSLVAGRLLGKPYSLSIHAGADIYVHPILLREKIMESRKVVTCTQHNQSHLEAILGKDLSGKIGYVNHGLDLDMYLPSVPNTNGDPLILSVGQLAERKGFAQLIKSCRDLKDQGYRFRCQIIGQGPQRQALETLITQLTLDDTVTLCGALPHEEVIEKYREAAIFVLPCIQTKNGDVDGIPNVLPEAMAMQVPVISTRVSAIPELIQDQVNGLLSPPEDHASLASAMARLLDEPSLRQELGRNGRQSILDKFDVRRNVREFAETLWPENFTVIHV